MSCSSLLYISWLIQIRKTALYDRAHGDRNHLNIINIIFIDFAVINGTHSFMHSFKNVPLISLLQNSENILSTGARSKKTASLYATIFLPNYVDVVIDLTHLRATLK